MYSQDLYHEVNEDVVVGTFRGRVVIHVLRELSSDLFRNFIYCTATGRFVRGPESFVGTNEVGIEIAAPKMESGFPNFDESVGPPPPPPPPPLALTHSLSP